MKYSIVIALTVLSVFAVVLNAQPQYTEQKHSLTGCLRTDGTAPKTYQLTDVEKGPKSVGLMIPRFDVSPHIGHKIEVTGIDIPAKDAEWAANTQRHELYMRIDAIKMISTACPPFTAAQNASSSDTPSSYQPDLKLRGSRFKALTWADLDPAQKAMAEHMMMGERGGMNGPFNTAIRSPEAGDLAERLGAQQRFHTSLPVKLNEFAILITAHFWNAQYEWGSHQKIAVAAGLNPAIVDALAADKRPPNMSPDEEAIYNFGIELLHTRHVSDANFNALKEKFGERGVVDLTGIMGYYSWVSLMLDVDP
jgi:4-carboxymuconolactone decarboxylase